MNILYPIAFAIGVVGLAYSAITGDAIGADIQYNWLGRVLNGGAAVLLLYLALKFRRDMREIRSMRDEVRDDDAEV